MIGRKNSSGFPGKNTYKIFGTPMCEFPLKAAKQAKCEPRLFVSTDCENIKKIALKYDAEIIDRPPELATNQALGEDAFHHGYKVIQETLKSEGKTLTYLILLFANAPTISSEMIDKGISILNEQPDKDSAVSTSVYNMWSPLRARKLEKDGCLKPFVPFETFGNPRTLNCDRDSQGDVHYADMSVSVVRPACIEHMKDGMLPQKWMGNKIAAIPSWGGCDVDYEWQIPMVEYWIKKNNLVPTDFE